MMIKSMTIIEEDFRYDQFELVLLRTTPNIFVALRFLTSAGSLFYFRGDVFSRVIPECLIGVTVLFLVFVIFCISRGFPSNCSILQVRSLATFNIAPRLLNSPQ